MKLLSVSVILSLFLFNCSSDSNIDSGTTRISQSDYYEEPYESDLVSFEMSFGSELSDTKNEFLLVNPEQICVNNQGDIIMSDEKSIKVFDIYGKGKKKFGRPGQGPGEFGRIPLLFLSTTGYLMVLDFDLKGLYTPYNLYAPDYTFIEKSRLSNNQRLENYLYSKGYELKNIGEIRNIYALDKFEKVYEVFLLKTTNNVRQYTDLLVYENADTLVSLFHVKQPLYITGPGFVLLFPILGNLQWKMLPDRRIVYIYTEEDIYNENGVSYYTIHLLSLDTFEDKKITREFSPVMYLESAFDSNTYKRLPDAQKKAAVKAFKDKKFFPSYTRMKVDGNFVFISVISNVKREMKEWSDSEEPVDVFDSLTEKFTGRFKFPLRLSTIKDGYVYDVDYDKDGFLEIRKYKINPIVYGLPEDPDWKTKK